MSTQQVGSCPAGARRPSSLGALALIVLVLQTACAGVPRSSVGGTHDYQPLAPRSSDGATSPTAGADAEEADDDEDEPGRVRLPTDFGAVRVSEAEFREAMAGLLLEVPMRVAASAFPSPLYASRGRMLASAQPVGEEWQSELAKSYGRYCERCGTPGDCLELFKDGSRFDAEDKARLALALAVGPALEARDAELRNMFSTAQLWTTVSITLGVYLALLASPEPVSKGVAVAFTALMWGYLGWELFDLMRGYVQLQEDAARATTFAELREVGERFGKVIGPNSVRILVMLGTAAVGSTAQLMSRAPKLPGFARAARSAGSRGVRLLTAAEEADRVKVAVADGTIHIVLPANAFSMAARGTLADAVQRKNKPELHHIATVENNKSTLRGGPWTPRLKKIFDKAGMSMDDPANKIQIKGHKGPHPEKYHQRVYDRLFRATAKCRSTLQCRDALIEELRRLAQELSDENSEIYKLLVEGAPH
ncbi:AHH domain-containing protein [Vitiosangium sp. GDMCC 1.1324]|uniref:AHH domain-containing protein n=1 Tax=Vitiosangium sp. (strain GDMCC 1.1324) TaxID=2138576 RepID=UPI000D3D00F2|nr:AHH domain-containing protein [Vitiosangium sp. GDMCC 1.1324]PTL77722.1 hypothetical protein DAT35_43865 [Vitiosangium sp. GDMCC 1.1324]